jgi:hypothetical protein
VKHRLSIISRASKIGLDETLGKSILDSDLVAIASTAQCDSSEAHRTQMNLCGRKEETERFSWRLGKWWRADCLTGCRDFFGYTGEAWFSRSKITASSAIFELQP